MRKISAFLPSWLKKLLSNHICFDVDKTFVKTAHELTAANGLKRLDCKTITAIYNEITDRDNIVRALEKNEVNFEDVKTIILGYIYKYHTYNELVASYSKSKKEQLGLNVKDILKLNSENRDVEDFIKRLSESKKRAKALKTARAITLDELRAMYFPKDENLKILKNFINVRKENGEAAAELFIKAVFRGIKPETFADVTRMLAKHNLKIPDKTLFELFDDKINILKTIKTLTEAKKRSFETVKNLYPTFDDAAAEKFANVYTVEGKNRLKKTISDTVLSLGLLEDPAEIYLALVRSEGKGFKLNLETILDYIKYDFTQDIEKISDVYHYARDKGLHIEYQQLAKLAEQEIDIKALVDAEIKSRNK